ncbi:hypothetical protein [Alloyangia pacifica]|nr:hypothetical protein [Alloyangia pacifica]
MAVLIWDLSARLTEQRVRNEEGAKASREQTTERIELHCGANLSPTLLRRCLEDEIEAGEDAKRAERNLQSQEEVALFTRIMGYTGVAGSAVGLLSVFLVYFTLRETQRMARDTRQIGEAQAQAYVTASEAEFVWGGPFRTAPEILIFFENSGQTPVKWFQFRAFPMVYAHDSAGTDGFPKDWPSDADLGTFSNKWSNLGRSEKSRSVKMYLRQYGISAEDLATLRHVGSNVPTHGIAVFGEVRYCTFFGDVFTSQFVFGRRVLEEFVPDTASAADGEEPLARRGRPQRMSAVAFDLKAYHREN